VNCKIKGSHSAGDPSQHPLQLVNEAYNKAIQESKEVLESNFLAKLLIVGPIFGQKKKAVAGVAIANRLQNQVGQSLIGLICTQRSEQQLIGSGGADIQNSSKRIEPVA